MEVWATIKKLSRELFSESGAGFISWGRVASTVALIAGIAWVTHIVWTTKTLPALDGVTAFGVGPYAANKVAAATQAFANKN